MLRGMKAKVTRLNYCQFLVSTQINYTLTYFADHATGFSHDAVKAYLERDKITPRLLWEQVKGDVVTSPEGFILFDDTVADKNHSRQMELCAVSTAAMPMGSFAGSVLSPVSMSTQSWIVSGSLIIGLCA